jgi:hypothetical protein
MADTKRSTYATAIAIFVLLGLASVQIPKVQQLAYAHTFSGNESSAFIATIGVLRTEVRLINDTVATNSSQSNEHAKIAVGHLSANDTNELAERNKRIATDLPKDLSSLQNITANLSLDNTTGITAVKQKVSDTDALLSEAIQVRIEPTQLTNATVYGIAVGDLLNETLERYGEAIGLGQNTSTSATLSSNATNNTSIDTATMTNSSNATLTSTNNNSIMNSTRNNTTVTIVSYADYQSTIGLANMTKEMFNYTKSLMNNTGNTSAISKMDGDLTQLKTLIDNKSGYTRVATFVYNTIYPDLNSTLNLGLQKVDANKAIQDALSGAE